MQTKTELTLEQTQQGVSDEVLVSIRKVKIKGEKKEALLTLSYHGPIMRTPSAAAKSCQGDSFEFYLITGGNPDGGRSDEVLKLKNFKKDDYTSFQDQEKYEHVGLKVTSTQDGKRSQDDDKRLHLDDDLKKLKDHMHVKLKGTSSSLKSKDHYAYHKLEDKIQDHEQRPKTFIE
ncbi:hypothetical protein Tco_0781309 [Tanacetum coccineum]